MIIQTLTFELWLFQYHGCFGMEPNSISPIPMSRSKRTLKLKTLGLARPRAFLPNQRRDPAARPRQWIPESGRRQQQQPPRRARAVAPNGLCLVRPGLCFLAVAGRTQRPAPRRREKPGCGLLQRRVTDVGAAPGRRDKPCVRAWGRGGAGRSAFAGDRPSSIGGSRRINAGMSSGATDRRQR